MSVSKKTPTRIVSKSWLYPTDLVKAIKNEIRIFFESRGLLHKLTTTPGNFEILKLYISDLAKLEITEVWLRDLYFYGKESEVIKRVQFNALLKSFNYQYNETDNRWIKLLDENSSNFYNIFNYLKPQINDSNSLIDLTGKYKYFLVTKREPNYYNIYQNEIEIFIDKTVKIYNPFLEKYYYGIALLKNHNVLQIVSLDFNQFGINSIGNLLTFKINEYKRKAILFPGLAFSFDGESNPMAAQCVLCSEFSMTNTDDLIVSYFKTIASEGKYSCPSTRDIEELRFNLKSKNLK